MFGIGLLKGLFTTLKNLFGPVFTVQYPTKSWTFRSIKISQKNSYKFYKNST